MSRKFIVKKSSECQGCTFNSILWLQSPVCYCLTKYPAHCCHQNGIHLYFKIRQSPECHRLMVTWMSGSHTYLNVTVKQASECQSHRHQNVMITQSPECHSQMDIWMSRSCRHLNVMATQSPECNGYSYLNVKFTQSTECQVTNCKGKI